MKSFLSHQIRKNLELYGPALVERFMVDEEFHHSKSMSFVSQTCNQDHEKGYHCVLIVGYRLTKEGQKHLLFLSACPLDSRTFSLTMLLHVASASIALVYDS